jgi:hypothetical protein
MIWLLLPSTTLRQQQPAQVTKVRSGFFRWMSDTCFVFTWWLSEAETTIIDFYNSALHPAMHRMPGSKS